MEIRDVASAVELQQAIELLNQHPDSPVVIRISPYRFRQIPAPDEAVETTIHSMTYEDDKLILSVM